MKLIFCLVAIFSLTYCKVRDSDSALSGDKNNVGISGIKGTDQIKPVDIFKQLRFNAALDNNNIFIEDIAKSANILLEKMASKQILQVGRIKEQGSPHRPDEPHNWLDPVISVFKSDGVDAFCLIPLIHHGRKLDPDGSACFVRSKEQRKILLDNDATELFLKLNSGRGDLKGESDKDAGVYKKVRIATLNALGEEAPP